MEATIKDDRAIVQLAPCCFTCRHLKTNYKTAYDECKRDGDEVIYYYDLGERQGAMDRLVKKCPQWECFPQEETQCK